MVIAVIVLVVLALLMLYCRIETMLLKTTVYSFCSCKVPYELDGKRIVLLTDLHCTVFGKDNSRLLQMIKAADPDIIIIAGDLINGRRSVSQLKYAYDLLSGLHDTGIPLFYEFGNHECRLEGSFSGDGAYGIYLSMCAKYCTVINNTSVRYPPDNKIPADAGCFPCYHAHIQGCEAGWLG